MPEWIWLDEWKRYRDLETGEWLAGTRAREWARLAAAASGDATGMMATMVNEGQLNVSDWTLLMRDEIKDAYVQEYVLGRGGLDQMTQRDWGSIGGMLREQYRYLDNFAHQVADGEVSPGRIAQRAKMYAHSAREAYYRAHERALGMPPLPDRPGSGNTICMTNCQCDWDIREVRDKAGKIVRWDCYWLLRPAEHCTSEDVDKQGRPRGCIQRAALWGPLVLKAKAFPGLDSIIDMKGGEGSGYHAPHYGRPGKIGGSRPRGVVDGDGAEPLTPERIAENIQAMIPKWNRQWLDIPETGLGDALDKKGYGGPEPLQKLMYHPEANVLLAGGYHYAHAELVGEYGKGRWKFDDFVAMKRDVGNVWHMWPEGLGGDYPTEWGKCYAAVKAMRDVGFSEDTKLRIVLAPRVPGPGYMPSTVIEEQVGEFLHG